MGGATRQCSATLLCPFPFAARRFNVFSHSAIYEKLGTNWRYHLATHRKIWNVLMMQLGIQPLSSFYPDPPEYLQLTQCDPTNFFCYFRYYITLAFWLVNSFNSTNAKGKNHTKYAIFLIMSQENTLLKKTLRVAYSIPVEIWHW